MARVSLQEEARTKMRGGGSRGLLTHLQSLADVDPVALVLVDGDEHCEQAAGPLEALKYPIAQGELQADTRQPQSA